MISWTTDEKVLLPLMLLGIIILAIILGILLKNKSERIKSIPLIIISIIVLILEIIKQILNIASKKIAGTLSESSFDGSKHTRGNFRKLLL